MARRTVTKYRKMLNIPSSRQRKDWTAEPRESEGMVEEPPEQEEAAVAQVSEERVVPG